MSETTQWIVKRVGLLALLVCLGAAEEAPDLPASRSWVMENILSVVIFGVIALGIGGWSIGIMRHRIAQQRADEEQAAKLLEARVLGLLAARKGNAPGESVTGERAAEDALSMSLPSSSKAGVEPVAAAGAGPQELASAVEDILNKLRAGGLFAGLEGSLYLSDGQSEGKIIRLTNGSMAMVLPHVESAEFLARQLKRFDLCIMVLGGGQACVVSRLRDFIAGHFSL